MGGFGTAINQGCPQYMTANPILETDIYYGPARDPNPKWSACRKFKAGGGLCLFLQGNVPVTGGDRSIIQDRTGQEIWSNMVVDLWQRAAQRGQQSGRDANSGGGFCQLQVPLQWGPAQVHRERRVKCEDRVPDILLGAQRRLHWYRAPFVPNFIRYIKPMKDMYHCLLR